MKGIIKQKRTKSMDMRFYWVRDQVEHIIFDFKWKPGNMNLGNYFTKYHPPTQHRSIRKTYLINTTISVQERILRGSAKIGTSELGNTGLNPNLGRDMI